MKTQKTTRHFDNDDNTFLSFRQFCKYCEAIYADISYIEKFYSKQFNEKSTETITTYKKLFEFYLKTFYYVCYDENKTINRKLIDSLSPKNQTTYYLESLHQLVTNRDDFYIGNRIAQDYYEKIETITNKIFHLEDTIANITNIFWKNSLSRSVEDIKDGKFACLAKVLIDWREDNASKSLSKYMDSRYALSVSYITNYKSRFFGERNSSACRVGILYYCDEIIAGLNSDAYLEEFVDGKCPLKRHEIYTNIQRTSIIGNHEIFSFASKIATPKSVLFKDNERRTVLYNEVIVDKKHTKPFAVFCIRKVNDIKVENYTKALFLAQQMSKRFKLPLVELDSKNEFANLDENSLDIKDL